MLRQQVADIRPWLVLTVVVAAVSGAVFLGVHYGTSVNVEVLTVDPVAEVGLPPYVGVFSHIGILLLSAAASISMFGWCLLRRASSGVRGRGMVGVLGPLLLWLAIDDLFLIHEEIGRMLADLLDRPEDRSLLESPVLVFYAMVWIIWFVRFRREFARTPFFLLALGVASLAVSMLIDIGEFVVPNVVEATPWMPTTLNMAEELAKLVGIVLLFGYAVSTTMRSVRRAYMPRAAGERRGATGA